MSSKVSVGHFVLWPHAEQEAWSVRLQVAILSSRSFSVALTWVEPERDLSILILFGILQCNNNCIYSTFFFFHVIVTSTYLEENEATRPDNMPCPVDGEAVPGS